MDVAEMEDGPVIYILAKVVSGRDVYWTGEFRLSGLPEFTHFKCEAEHFKTTREAYQTAGLRPELSNWRVIPR